MGGLSRVIACRVGFYHAGCTSGRIPMTIGNRQAARPCDLLTTPPNIPLPAVVSNARLWLLVGCRNAYREASVHGEAGCISCCQPRVLKALFPVAEGVELKLYECAGCTSSMWLITKVSRSFTPKRGREERQLTTIDAALKSALGVRRCSG